MPGAMMAMILVIRKPIHPEKIRPDKDSCMRNTVSGIQLAEALLY